MQVLTGQNAIRVNRLTHWRPFDGTRMTVARASAAPRATKSATHINHFLTISASEKFCIVCLIFSGKFSFHPNFWSIKRVTLDWKALRVPVVKAQSARSLGTRRHPQRNITTFKTFIQHMPQTKIQQHLYRNWLTDQHVVKGSLSWFPKRNQPKEKKKISAGKSEWLINTLRQCDPCLSPSDFSLFGESRSCFWF